MSGNSFPANVYRGRFVQRELDGVTWKALLLTTTGLDSDDTLADFDDVAALIAANDELSTAGYSRPTITLTRTVNDTPNTTTIVVDADMNFGTPAAGETVAKLVIYEHQAGGDANCIPAAIMDYDAVPDGNTLLALAGLVWTSS